jgi:hypothetical protein
MPGSQNPNLARTTAFGAEAAVFFPSPRAGGQVRHAGAEPRHRGGGVRHSRGNSRHAGAAHRDAGGDFLHWRGKGPHACADGRHTCGNHRHTGKGGQKSPISAFQTHFLVKNATKTPSDGRAWLSSARRGEVGKVFSPCYYRGAVRTPRPTEPLG